MWRSQSATCLGEDRAKDAIVSHAAIEALDEVGDLAFAAELALGVAAARNHCLVLLFTPIARMGGSVTRADALQPEKAVRGALSIFVNRSRTLRIWSPKGSAPLPLKNSPFFTSPCNAAASCLSMQN